MTDTSHTRWDDRSSEQWLDEARRFEEMAERFSHHDHLNASFSALARDALVRAKDGRPAAARVMHSRDWSVHVLPRLASSTEVDVAYLRRRAQEELASAREAVDVRVSRVHLELAERYGARIHAAERLRKEGLARAS
jgi:hypothetical protein